MTEENDIDYYRRREANARALAELSTDFQIKRIHAEMAERYADRVREMTRKPQLRLIHPNAG